MCKKVFTVFGEFMTGLHPVSFTTSTLLYMFCFYRCMIYGGCQYIPIYILYLCVYRYIPIMRHNDSVSVVAYYNVTEYFPSNAIRRFRTIF